MADARSDRTGFERTRAGLISGDGKTFGFSFDEPGFLGFMLESTYRVWANVEAKRFFEQARDRLPPEYRDPRRVGVPYFYSDMGMEGFCHLIVQKFDCLEGNPYDLRTLLFPETEVTVFSTDGEIRFAGEVGKIMDRLDESELRFCFVGLKMEKHGLFGLPVGGPAKTAPGSPPR